jgi:Pectate lyase superfamily protein
MAIVQISRIQHRSGYYENLPQLSKAELGYAVDERRLFIGNGTLLDGAPETGHTEILTEHSEILNLANTYTYRNTDSGYNPVTGGSRPEFNKVTYGNNLYVAVGTNGSVLTSADGVSWSNTASGVTNNLLSITYGNSKFVAVGGNGTVIYSSNATTWQSSGAVAYTTINDVVFGNGIFVLVTLQGSIFTSPDGITWTQRASGVTTSLNSITFNGSTFVAVGMSGTVAYSADGIAWSNTTVSQYDLSTVRYLNSVFVAVGSNSKIYTSADGISWNSSLVDAFTDVTTNGTDIYAITSWGDVYISSGTGLNYLSTVTTGVETFNSIVHNQSGQVLALTGGGAIYFSTNGISWSLKTTAAAALNAAYWDTVDLQWVIVGNSGLIYTSPDGNTFTLKTNSNTSNLYGISRIPGGNYIAVGASGTVLTSSNTSSWTLQSSGTSNDLNSITVANLGGGTYKAVAVGNNGVGIYSSNGVGWFLGSNNSALDPQGNTVSLGNLYKVIYVSWTPPGGSLSSYYFVVGDDGVLAISTNFSTGSWNTKYTYTSSDLQGIAYSPTNNIFFAVGDTGLSYLTGQDGSTWSTLTEYFGTNLIAPVLRDSATNATSYILVGQYGLIYEATSQYKFFKKISTSLTYDLDCVVYNTQFVASGASGQLAYSTDGINWIGQSYSYGNAETSRRLQNKLDDFVSVKDFGAKGDGSTDDTEAINRALYELYCRSTSTAARKILYFPAGNYIISSDIKVPSHARIKGEGSFNTQITQTRSPYIAPYITWVMYTSDNKQQTQTLIGLNGADLPNDIFIQDMTLVSTGDGIIIDSASRVTLQNIRFKGPKTSVSLLNDNILGVPTAAVKVYGQQLVSSSDFNLTDCLFDGFNLGVYLPANQNISNTLIDSCTFTNLHIGIFLAGYTAKNVTVSNSIMDQVYSNGCYVTNANNFLSFANYYKEVANDLNGYTQPATQVIYLDGTAIGCGSIADQFDRTDTYNLVYSRVSETTNSVEWNLSYALRLGAYQQNMGKSATIANNTTAVISTGYDDYTDTGGYEIIYKLSRNSQVRNGIIKFSKLAAGTYAIDDDYTCTGETGVTFSFSGTDLQYTSDSTGTGTFDYAIRYVESL